MNELALFSGAGGGILASQILGFNTVCAVEIEEYPRNVLLQRQRDGILPTFPVWDDVQTFDGRPWRNKIDVISGGFPCQDISAAGKGVGIAGARSGLWKEYARIIDEVRPSFVFAENSPLLRTRGLNVVLKDLDRLGYDARWCVLGAWHVGAPHKRNRMWVLANSRIRRCCCTHERKNEQQRGAEVECSGVEMANSYKEGLSGSAREKFGSVRATKKGEVEWGNPERGIAAARSAWPIEPDVGRVAHGLAKRVDRIKAIGNGQVPRVAVAAWEILSG
jgi:DNA (cytosine-5)-methyltransferase 1